MVMLERISLRPLRKYVFMPLILLVFLTGCRNKNEETVNWDEEMTARDNKTEQTIPDDDIYDMTPTAIVVLNIGDRCFTINLEDNSSADEFFEEINHGPLTVEMHDYGNFEKVGDLPWDLPTNDKEITTSPGDLILYQGNKITVYYDENTWSFTKLGHISAGPDEIREVFGGKDDITAEFFVEWTE